MGAGQWAETVMCADARMKWIVCQIGAREHYAVARALQRRGKLAALVTDLWAPPGSWLRCLPQAASLAGRYEKELEGAKVFAPNARTIFLAARARLFRWSGWKTILAANAQFQKEAGRFLFSGRFDGEDRTLFAYSYAAKDLFREAKRRGWRTVLGQIDPGPGEQRIVDVLRAKHPEWTGDPQSAPPPEYWNEWREECDLADRIVVNSAWSKVLLGNEGIDPAKIDVVPLAYAAAGGWRTSASVARKIGGSVEGEEEKYLGESVGRWDGVSEDRGRNRSEAEIAEGKSEVRDQRSEDAVASEEWRVAGGEEGKRGRKDEGTKGQKDQCAEGPGEEGGRIPEFRDQREYPAVFTKERPMRVLFLGQVILRKGIQDLVEAARILGEGPWRFDVVGGRGVLRAEIPKNVFFHGQVPRGGTSEYYDKADVFVLPTHSDGFALTQIEAMAHGLPVVATPCCGEVVTPGVDGMLVPAGDPEKLAEAIKSLAGDPLCLARMSAAAREKAKCFRIDAVGDALCGAQ